MIKFQKFTALNTIIKNKFKKMQETIDEPSKIIYNIKQ